MTFILKLPEPKSGSDCKDFKPKFWNKEHCKLSNKCNFRKQDYIESMHYGVENYCTGIKWDESLPKSRKLPKGDPRLINN